MTAKHAFKVGDEVRDPNGRVGVIREILRANRDYHRRAVIDYGNHTETFAVQFLRVL